MIQIMAWSAVIAGCALLILSVVSALACCFVSGVAAQAEERVCGDCSHWGADCATEPDDARAVRCEPFEPCPECGAADDVTCEECEARESAMRV